MKPLPQSRINPLFTLTLLSGSILLGVWLLSTAKPVKLAIEPSGAVTAPASPGQSQQPDEDEYRAHIHAMFAEVRRQARAARKMPDVAALLAIANSIDPNFTPTDIPGLPISSADDKRRYEALTNAINTMSLIQRLRAFQQMLAIQPASEGRSYALAALSESLTSPGSKGQPEAMARWLLEPANRFPESKEVEEYASGAIVAWGRTDARAAADFAAGLTPGTDVWSPMTKVLLEVCSNWDKDDPAGALSWAETLPDTDIHKVYALEGVFSYFNEFDPDEARACVERLVGVNKAAPELASQIAGELAQRQMQKPNGSQAVAQWALSLSGLPERHEALKAAIGGWVESDGLPQTVQWATALPPSESRGVARGTVATMWEGCDTSGHPQPPSGLDDVHERITINAKVVNNWLGSLPVGEDRDEAIAIRDQWEDSMKKLTIWR